MDWRGSDREGGHHARVEVQVDLRWRGCGPAPADAVHKQASVFCQGGASAGGYKRLPPSAAPSRYENFESAYCIVQCRCCVQMLVWGLPFFFINTMYASRRARCARGRGWCQVEGAEAYSRFYNT